MTLQMTIPISTNCLETFSGWFTAVFKLFEDVDDIIDIELGGRHGFGLIEFGEIDEIKFESTLKWNGFEALSVPSSKGPVDNRISSKH